MLIATSALGAGMDHPGVRLVIHHGHANSMIDLCQETGRAGRDGNPAEAMTLFWPGIVRFTDHIKEEDRRPVLSWIRDEGCRRVGIGEYLNGVGRDCLSMSKGEFCDRCEGVIRSRKVRPMNVQKSRSLRGMDLEAKDVREETDLKEMIRDLRGRCTLCWILTIILLNNSMDCWPG